MRQLSPSPSPSPPWPSLALIYYLPTNSRSGASFQFSSTPLLGPYNQSHQSSSGLMEKSSGSPNIREHISMLSKHLNPLFNKLHGMKAAPLHASLKRKVWQTTRHLGPKKSPHQPPLTKSFAMSPSGVLNRTETKSWRSFPLYICAWKGAFFHSLFCVLISVKLTPQ